MKPMALKVSEVARLAGVSVRTLHHYDEIGLCRPSGRSQAGYRMYAAKDLERLQQVLFFRELDFPLDEIQRILADPDFDVAVALRMQRQLLYDKAARIRALIAAVEAALSAREEGTTMSHQERFAVFGEFDPKAHEDEVRQRWGDSEAYRQSHERSQRYGASDWEKIKAEGDAVFAGLAKLAQAGTPASSEAAMALAEQHRLHIERWFYACPPHMHQGLGELYVHDERFTANIDRYHPGLAAYARQAFAENARRARPHPAR
jgi:DNA-binding transcriptional MerR regulator